MRIGIDMRSLEGGAQHRGIGRYATELLRALSDIDHKNEYVFFTSHPKALAPELELNTNFKQSNKSGRSEGLRGVKYIRIIYITPRALQVDKYNLDVFFHIDTSQPITVKATPIVSVVYDLIPYIYKDMYQHVHLGGYTPGHLIGYTRMKIKWKIMESWLQNYRRDTRVISISEHSKRDLIKFVPGLDPKKIIAIPLAAGSTGKPDEAAQKSMAKLKLKDFFFYVGGADPRKGLVDLVTSFEDVWQEFPDAQLVLAGKEVTNPKVDEALRLHETVKKLSRPSQIKLLGFISDYELAWLMENAVGFVWPSRYEGFGLPILEAMQYGCPVITYDNSSLPEVAGDAAIVLKDGASMAPAMCELLGSQAKRKQLAQKGKKQAENFNWQYTAKATLKVLEAAGKK